MMVTMVKIWVSVIDGQYLFVSSAEVTWAFQAKHQDVFPSKNLLQLKIREVRQRMMASMSGSTEMERSSGPSASTVATSGNDAAGKAYK